MAKKQCHLPKNWTQFIYDSLLPKNCFITRVGCHLSYDNYLQHSLEKCLMKLPRKLLLEKILPHFWNYENPNSSFLTNKKLLYVVSYSKNNFWSISLIQTFSSCTNPKIVRCVTLHTCINCRRIMSGVERTDPSARKFVLHS